MARASLKTLLALLPFLAAGCGAPVKSAAEVASLFEGSGTTLQQKETTLCEKLAEREDGPSTKDMSIDLGDCSDAGRAALDYKKISSFYFIGLDGKVPSKDKEQLIHKAARGQVWLNKSLLGLAGSLAKMMKDKQDVGDNTGAISLPDSGNGQFNGLVTPEITVVEEPELDTETLQMTMKLHLKVTGAVEADHDIEIKGGLIDNAFAVTVRTMKDQPYEKSIFKNFQAVVLIIPHASDVYLDMYVDMNIYNIGLDSLFKDQVNTFLSTGLKSVIDSTMQL